MVARTHHSRSPALARLVLLLYGLMLGPRAGAQGMDEEWTALLATHVTDGMVDYDGFDRDPRFHRYLADLATVDAATLARPAQLAYWINTYNAWTIYLITSRRERSSIRNINRTLGISRKSPWAERIVQVRGRTLTLDDVEHRIIRPTFGDPRIHVALVCAARGCPPLRREAYRGEDLDAQLDDQARVFLSQSTKNRVDVERRIVHGSPIFTWYRDDFGGSLAGVGAFWARYLPPGPARDIVQSGQFAWVDTKYDWSLNLRR